MGGVGMATRVEREKRLPLEAVARCLDKQPSSLCQACINGEYPTAAGARLYQIALENSQSDRATAGRTYDAPLTASATP